jgi:CheY-like chemotaxis protein
MFNPTPTLLIVDDSRVNIALLKEVLNQYNLISASNGADAIELATSMPQPDLILLDIIMPGMDGYEVCRRLKENKSTKDIPIVFITGQTDADSVIKGFEAGAVDYITKPFKFPELKARVKSQLIIKVAHDQNEELRRKIEDINKKLTDSIEYARKIQNASYPKAEYLDSVMPEYFILLKPRDIVSGDFYWICKKGSKLVVVAADCTGHGVPGAIMGMFGVAYLREIIEVKGQTQPSLILDDLRSVVIDAFQQDENSEVKDGMDMSVVTFDFNNQMLEYAGAFNPVFIVRDGEMTIVPADRMPVSYGEKKRSFSNHVISYRKGDCIYLFSDGFASQFGGGKDKKLKQHVFRNLIIDHYMLSMSEQQRVYDAFFEQWKGNKEQIDDVLLMGIRL